MGCWCSTPLPNSAKVDLSHFTVLRTIGKGGFGTVTAVQKLSEPLKDETFAMKTMGKVQLLQSRQGLRIAWRERNVLRIVKSPFVPKLHYAFQDEGSLYLVLDFLTGGDLSFLIKKRSRLSEKEVQFYAAEIALGMEELHSRNIVYRDLKPANILLDKLGHVRITDFGIVSLLKEESNLLTKGDAGTPGYQSPEMLKGQLYSFEPDFFAYGITLYHMLSGKKPFSDNTKAKEVNFEPRSWKHISEIARTLISSLLAINPTDRLTDWTALKKHQFFEGVDWEAIAACKVEPPIVPDSDKINFPIECEMEAVLMPEVHQKLKDQERFNGYSYDGHAEIPELDAHVQDDSSPTKNRTMETIDDQGEDQLSLEKVAATADTKITASAIHSKGERLNDVSLDKSEHNRL